MFPSWAHILMLDRDQDCSVQLCLFAPTDGNRGVKREPFLGSQLVCGLEGGRSCHEVDRRVERAGHVFRQPRLDRSLDTLECS